MRHLARTRKPDRSYTVACAFDTNVSKPCKEKPRPPIADGDALGVYALGFFGVDPYNAVTPAIQDSSCSVPTNATSSSPRHMAQRAVSAAFRDGWCLCWPGLSWAPAACFSCKRVTVRCA